jgi:cell division protein FtsB
MNANRRRATNLIEVNFLSRWLVIVFLIGLAGIFFVYLKNQQHAVGDETRIVEAALNEAEAENEALAAKITALTSRGALQRRLDDGYLHLEAIRDTAIARVTPAMPAEPDGVLRTASREPESRLDVEAPQRSINR